MLIIQLFIIGIFLFLGAKVYNIFLPCKFFIHFFDKMIEKTYFCRRFIRKRQLKDAVCLLFVVPRFQDVESFLLLALVAEETLHIVVVLNVGQHATG